MSDFLKLGARLAARKSATHACVRLFGEVVNDDANIDSTFSQFGFL